MTASGRKAKHIFLDLLFRSIAGGTANRHGLVIFFVFMYNIIHTLWDSIFMGSYFILVIVL